MKKVYFLLFAVFTFGNIHAQVEGTWTLAPKAQALAVGPAFGDFSWWSNSAGDVDTRACLFDDQFVFNADGSFQNIQDGETWLEGWQGMDPEGCGAPIAPHDGSSDATWEYDADAGMLTITGVGAHLGLAKVVNGAEIASPGAAPESISYPVTIDGDAMTIDINFGPGYWHFELVKQVADSPLVGAWKIAPEAQALAVGPAFGDFSWWSNSAGDVDTRACLFDDQFVFNADGSFQNIQDGDTWLEAWQGMDPEGCGAPIAPHDGSNAATWEYDEAAGELTLTGVGAHLGLAKVINGAEITNPADAPASVTYPVVIDEGRMTVDINFGPGYWHFVLVKAEEATNTFEVAKEDLFSFFPNPASAFIQVQSEQGLDELIIRDITGKVVKAQARPAMNETIDVSSLSRGLYIIEARAGNKVSVEKLSIN